MQATAIIAAMGDIRAAAAKHLAAQDVSPEVIEGLRATAKRYARHLLSNEPRLAKEFLPEQLEAMLLRVVDEVAAAQAKAA